jgi:hypothetical protein
MSGLPAHGCCGQAHPACPSHLAGDENVEHALAVPPQIRFDASHVQPSCRGQRTESIYAVQLVAVPLHPSSVQPKTFAQSDVPRDAQAVGVPLQGFRGARAMPHMQPGCAKHPVSSSMAQPVAVPSQPELTTQPGCVAQELAIAQGVATPEQLSFV